MTEMALLTPDELVSRLRGAVATGTLNNWRSKNRGPKYIKLGKKVFYPIVHVEAWEKALIAGASNDAELVEG